RPGSSNAIVTLGVAVRPSLPLQDAAATMPPFMSGGAMHDAGQVIVFDHPLIQQKLTQARDRRTDRREFRDLLAEIAALMVFELTRDCPARPLQVETPLQSCRGAMLSTEITLVPILRAGLGMLEGILHLIPQARVGHLGIYRDEKSLKPVTYYNKLPADVAATEVIVIDPMLATGGSVSHGLTLIKERGASRVKVLCLVAA